MKVKLRIATSYIIVLLVALVMAVNYQLFVFPNSFAPAGVNGILTMIQHVLDIKVSFASVVVNIPLALVCFLMDNKTRALRSLVQTKVESPLAGFLLECPESPAVVRGALVGAELVFS